MTDDLTKIDRSNWKGADFEFLITGDIEIANNDFDSLMTPNSMEWKKVQKNDWIYYQVGDDEFSYSWEMTGIQMTFNKDVAFEKAKNIADEVIQNINNTGQHVEMQILDNRNIYGFN